MKILIIAACLLCTGIANASDITDDTFVSPVQTLPPQGGARAMIAETQYGMVLSEIMFRTATTHNWHVFNLTSLSQNTPGAIVQAWSINNWDWDEETATWQTRQGTTSGPVACLMTFYGDADLDGDVDEDDNEILDDNWQQAGNWTDGDFNGDGIVNAYDMNLMAQNWHKTVFLDDAEVLYCPKPGNNIVIRCVSGSIRIESKEF